MKWKVLKQKAILDTPWLKVFSQKCITPKGIVIDPFYTIENPNWVMILASNTFGEIIMVRQYRHGSKLVLDEFPAGIIEKNEDIIEAAKREMLEETGYGEGEWTFLRDFSVNPDRQTTRFSVVLAKNLKQIKNTNLDKTEELEVYLKKKSDVDDLFASKNELHPFHLLAWKLWSEEFSY